MSDSTLRTFIAIDLPATLHAALRDYQQALAGQLDAQLPTPETPNIAGLRWTRPESMHLTLRFIGATDTSQLPVLEQALRATLATDAPLTLQVCELGAFPNLRKPRVLWVGIHGDTEPLHALQARIEQAVQAVGFAPETKPFRPHLTLARTVRAARANQLARLGTVLTELRAPDSRFSQPIGAPFAVSEIIHFQSKLPGRGQGGHPVYTPLARIPLPT